MHFDFEGFVPVDEIEVVLGALARFLKNEGLTEVSCLSISFLGWRGPSRCQIVNDEDWIRSISIDPSAINDSTELVLPETLRIRDRPDDLEFSPLALMMGRDD